VGRQAGRATYLCPFISMQKKFLTNLAFLLFLNLLIKPLWILGIDRTVQNTVGSAEYGLYYALFNFSFLFNILLDLGISNFNNRNIAQNQHLLNKHLSGILFLRMLLAALYTVCSLIVAWIIGYRGQTLNLLLILLFNQILISFIMYLRSNYSGIHLFRQDSIISVLDRFLMILFIGYLLWFRKSETPFQIWWFVWCQTLAYIITALLAFYFLARRARLQRLHWNPVFMWMILRKSFPFALLIFLMTIYFRIDGVMLERLLEDGKEKAGIYAQSFRLLDALSMIAFLFSTLLLPMFARMIKQKEDIHSLVRLAYSLLVIPSFIIGLTCYRFQSEIMSMLYHEHTHISAPVFGMMMFTYMAVSTSYIYGTLLTANGSLSILNRIAAGALLVNVALNLILIPRMEVMGAALSGLITQVASALLQAIYVYHIFRFKPDTGYIFRILMLLLFTCILLYVLTTWALPWVGQFILAIILSLGLAVVLRLIDLRAIMQIVRYEH
jgi:O-antigen/teichoic acid export membrane protein